jgi:predicted ferric reductase
MPHHSSKTAKFVGKQQRQAVAFRLALYCCFILLIAIIGLTEASDEESVNRIAKTADTIGLLAFGILVLQFLLASRLPWIERPFGLDLLIRFHRSMGVTAAVLLIAHPLLMALSGEPELLTKLSVAWPVQLGRAAVLVLFATVVVSLRRTALRIPYERWRFWHNVAAVAVLGLAFTHSFFVKDGIHTRLGRDFWTVLVGLAFLAWGYRHLREWHQHHGGRYVISQVLPEANNTWTVVLKADEGHCIPPHLPGQFAFIKIVQGYGAGEEHPFTIASAPEQDELVFTIRDSGDFTSRIHELQPGTKVLVHGPFGRFSAILYPEERELVFIAGGVGLTPFLSMVRSMHHSRTWRPVTVLHACRTEGDLLLREELSAIENSSQGRLRVVHVLSSPHDAWQGRCGHMNGDFIRQHVSESSEARGFYICGPPGMIKTIERDLKQMGISRHRIHSEKFAL